MERVDTRELNRLNQINPLVTMAKRLDWGEYVKGEALDKINRVLLWEGEEANRIETDVQNLIANISSYKVDDLKKRVKKGPYMMLSKAVAKLTVDGVRRNYISKIASDLMFQAESYKKWFLTPATPDKVVITINSVLETLLKIGMTILGEKKIKPKDWMICGLDYMEVDWKGKPTFDIEKFTDKVKLKKYIPGYSSPKDKERRMIIRLMMGVNNPAKFGRGMVLWVDAVAQNLQIISLLTSNKELAGYAGLDPKDMDNPEVFWNTPIEDFNTKLQYSFAKKYEDVIWESLKHLPEVKQYSKEELSRIVFVREIAKKIFMMWGFGSGTAKLLSKAPNYAEGVSKLKLPEKEHKELIVAILEATSMMLAVEGGFIGATLYKDTFDKMASEGTYKSYRDSLGWTGHNLVTYVDGRQKVVLTDDVVISTFKAIWHSKLEDIVAKGRTATVTLPDGTTVSKTNTRKKTIPVNVIGNKITYSSEYVENGVVPVVDKNDEILGYFLTHRTYLMSQLVHSTDGWIVKGIKNILKHYYDVSIISNHDAYGSHPEYTHLLRTVYANLLNRTSKANMLQKFVEANSTYVNPTKAVNKGDNYLNVMENFKASHYPWLLA